MSRVVTYRQLAYHYHEYDYAEDFYTFLDKCIERLRKRGHTPQAAMELLHDHVKLAGNYRAGGWK